MKTFRLFAKVHHKNEEGLIVEQNLETEYEKTLLDGFSLVRKVENETFENRHQTKKYLFDGENKNLIISEIKLIIDTLHGN